MSSKSKPKQKALTGKWISIEYEDKNAKAKWYKGKVLRWNKEQGYLISWETGGEDWVNGLADEEYRLAKGPPDTGGGPSKSDKKRERQEKQQQEAERQEVAREKAEKAEAARARKAEAQRRDAERPPKRPRQRPRDSKKPRLPKDATVLVYGLESAGKTSVVQMLHELQGQSAEPETGATHKFRVSRMKWRHTDGDVNLALYDFGGRADHRRSVWSSYFDRADAVVWVVDSTNRTSLHTCRQEMLSMLDYGVMNGVCLLVYANKLDLEAEQPLDVNELADHLEFNNPDRRCLQQRLWHIQSCSAKTGDGLQDGMEWLVGKVKNDGARLQRDGEYYYNRACDLRHLGKLREAEEAAQLASDVKFEQGGHQGAKQLQQELKRFQAGLRTGGKSGLVKNVRAGGSAMM